MCSEIAMKQLADEGCVIVWSEGLWLVLKEVGEGWRWKQKQLALMAAAG